MDDGTDDYRFPRSRRVVKRGDFDAAFKQGRVVSDHMLVLHVVANQQGATRLGMSISKRVGCAPIRNRWKRLIRESFRLNQAKLPAGIDIVARPRKGAEADFAAIQHSLVKLSARGAR